jgi:hypothetical protein
MGRRKSQTDEQNEKSLKPKEQFRIVLSLFDDGGTTDIDLIEYYINEMTGKRKRLMYDSPSQFKKSIEQNLGTNTSRIACYLLEAIGIDPNEFVRNFSGTVYEPPAVEESEE